MIKNLKKDMTVYVYQSIHYGVERGTVEIPKLEEMENGDKIISRIKWDAIVDENGNSIRGSYGSSAARLSKAFATAKEAFEARNAEIQGHKNKLKAEITDLKSLLEFPLNHYVKDGEYTDYFAQEIYKEAIKDFLDLVEKGGPVKNK